MDIVAIAMVLSAAVIHAVWNALAKRSGDALTFFWVITVAAVAMYALPFFVLLRNEPFEWDWLRFAIASALLHTAYFSLLAMAYARSELSFAYPVARGTGLLLVPLLAVPIFGDRPTVAAWFGIALVMAGVLLLHWPVFAAVIARSNPRALISIPALLTGLVIAVYSINDTAGVRRANPVVYLYVVEFLTMILLAPYVLTKRRAQLRPTLSQPWPVIVAGAGSAGTYMIVLAATRLAPVSYVVPVRETSIVIGAIIGSTVLGESLGKTRIVACLVVVAGVLAIGIGG